MRDSKKKIFWIVETAIVLFILIALVFASVAVYFYFLNKKNTYHIFMHDVYGLIKGSPVRLMGMQIGYVSNLEAIGDEIYLSFVVTHPNLRIPKNSSASVEFTGIAGSKSLEIHPPEKGVRVSSNENIVVLKQKRLGDFMNAVKKYSMLTVAIQENLAKIRTEDIEKIHEDIIKVNLTPAQETVDNMEKFRSEHERSFVRTVKRLDETSKKVDMSARKIDPSKMQEFERKIDKINEALKKYIK